MPVDMKHTIAKATETLLIDKKVMKLTVKDIVEECHITRQAFYYHFANIPELLDWIISQREEEMPEIHPGQEPSEDQLRYWSMIILNTTSHLKKMGKSAYFQEILDICFAHLKNYFTRIACKDESFRELDPFDQDLIIRYRDSGTAAGNHRFGCSDCVKAPGRCSAGLPDQRKQFWTGPKKILKTRSMSCSLPNGTPNGWKKPRRITRIPVF